MANLFTLPRKSAATIASASTINLPTDGDRADVSGTVTITTIDTTGLSQGARVWLVFTGACPITYDGAKLILAGGSSITTAAGDAHLFEVIGTNQVKELAPPSSGGGGSAAPDYILLQFSEASGTGGGGTTGGSEQNYPLNNKVLDTGSHCAFTGPGFVLDAGTYEFNGWAMFYTVGFVRLTLTNQTDSTVIAYGGAALPNVAQAQFSIPISGRFTIGASKTLKITYQCSYSIATVGLGNGTGFGPEIYGNFEFRKVA